MVHLNTKPSRVISCYSKETKKNHQILPMVLRPRKEYLTCISGLSMENVDL